jgi:HAMP domain-containing protein
VSDFTFNIVVVCFSLIAAAIVLSAGVLLRNYQRKLSEKVHSFENGQEEIENPEECSVKINDVGEQLPLSYDVIQGKISPMKRRVLS